MPAQAIIFSKERLFCGQGVGTLKEAERLPRSIVVTLQDNSWFLLCLVLVVVEDERIADSCMLQEIYWDSGCHILHRKPHKFRRN
mmetsp:Transcript_13986/g.42656  ORF Transcript_13986/g.42656 Transcript_13986/m.42656 type:complete len:85 (-) Transcript_13986:1152-1406(-)